MIIRLKFVHGVIIVFESFENHSPIWSFFHEIGNDTFVVPMRIITGFRNAQIDESAFKVTTKQDKIVVSELNENGEWFISVNNASYMQIYGEVALPERCYLKYTSRLKEVIIEVSSK